MDLELALQAHFPIVVIETHDEAQALKLLRKAITGNRNLGQLYSWSAADGLDTATAFALGELKVEGVDSYTTNKLADTADPETLLRYIKSDISNAVVLLPDFHPYLTNPKIVRLLKEISQQHYVNENTLILVSHSIDVPAELERLCTHVELSLPSIHEIEKIIQAEAAIWQKKNGQRVRADKKAMQLLAQNLLGLTHSDITRLVRNAIYDDGAITQSDVDALMEAKYKLVSEQGALSYEFDTASFSDLGGFRKLRQWLDVRKPFFVNQSAANSLDVPKGVLLLGIQGCGKSLAAKTIAGSWGVPLLRLDVAALYNKYIGETERNIREALKQAEMLAPCVLWVDEIEKAIQSGHDDTGTSNRLLGTFLTWLSEKAERVFVVATSNNVEKLPPELIRKGRLDEIFFVDLPNESAREEIFKLHLEKRQIKSVDFALTELAKAAAGFSGAEIEQAVVSARFNAHSKSEPIQSKHVLEEIQATSPLSVVRAEELEQLRHWAQDRTVGVD